MLSSAARKATKFENWNDLSKETENASFGCKSVRGVAQWTNAVGLVHQYLFSSLTAQLTAENTFPTKKSVF